MALLLKNPLLVMLVTSVKLWQPVLLQLMMTQIITLVNAPTTTTVALVSPKAHHATPVPNLAGLVPHCLPLIQNAQTVLPPNGVILLLAMMVL